MKRSASRTLQADENLAAAGHAHQIEKLGVVRDRDVRLGEPSKAERRELTAELLAPLLVNERVVVGELDERMGPHLHDGFDVANHVRDRPLAIALAKHHVGRAEVAAPGTAA